MANHNMKSLSSCDFFYAFMLFQNKITGPDEKNKQGTASKTAGLIWSTQGNLNDQFTKINLNKV